MNNRFNELYYKWTSRWWWKYLFMKPSDEMLSDSCCKFTAILKSTWCRYRGHPYEPIYYDPWGNEPDDRCSNCWDHISW